MIRWGVSLKQNTCDFGIGNGRNRQSGNPVKLGRQVGRCRHETCTYLWCGAAAEGKERARAGAICNPLLCNVQSATATEEIPSWKLENKSQGEKRKKTHGATSDRASSADLKLGGGKWRNRCFLHKMGCRCMVAWDGCSAARGSLGVQGCSGGQGPASTNCGVGGGP